MGIREQVRAGGQTLDAMAEAWLERWADAAALQTGGRQAARIYLLGYVAEMLLKVALFRLLGSPGGRPWRASDGPTLTDDYRAERGLLAALGQDADAGQLVWDAGHSLSLFATVLVRARRRRGMSGTNWERPMLRAVSDVHREWCVEMRYWPGQPSQAVADDVHAAVRDLIWLLT